MTEEVPLQPDQATASWILIVNLQGPGVEAGASAHVRFVGKGAWFEATKTLDSVGSFEITFTRWAERILEGGPALPADIRVAIGEMVVGYAKADLSAARPEDRDGQICKVVDVYVETTTTGIIKGLLVSPEGVAIADGKVGLFEHQAAIDPRLVMQAATDEGGEFQFEIMEPGEWLLAVVVEPWEPLVQRVGAVPGVVTDLGSLHLLEGAAIEGRVGLDWAQCQVQVNLIGQYQPQALLGSFLTWRGRALEYSTRTAQVTDDGYFSLAGLATGQAYSLMASTGKAGCRMAGITGEGRIEVQAPASDLDLQFGVPRVDVIVRAVGGSAIDGAAVGAYWRGDLNTRCYTGHGGKTRMLVLARTEVDLEVSREGYHTIRRSVNTPDLYGSAVELFELVPIDSGLLVVLARDPDGKPITSIRCEVLPDGAEIPWSVVSRAEDGIHALEGMPTGRQFVRVYENAARNSVYIPSTAEVDVQRGEEASLFVTLHVGGRLAVMVRDSHGLLVDAHCKITTLTGDPVDVTFVSTDPQQQHLVRDSARPHRGVITGDVYSEVEEALPVGTYRIEARAGPSVAKTMSFEVKSGQLSKVTIDLP